MKSFFSFVVLLLVVLSCQKGLDNFSNEEVEVFESKLVLGKKRDNPYSVANMRRAYMELIKETKTDLPVDEVIQATHLYIKFMPKDEQELFVLKADSTLVLFEYPLDYEILSYGMYHDPACPEDRPTPLYASVPATHHLPDKVDYVVLEDLFIPDEEGSFETKGSDLPPSMIERLVNKSLELTGNLESDSSITKGSKSWHPRGTIRYYDEFISDYVPVEGLQIRCRRWFTTRTAYTNRKGEFYCSDTFSKPAEYSVVFERYDFEIRSGWLSGAKYQQSNISGEWIVDFKDNSICTYYCTIKYFSINKL